MKSLSETNYFITGTDTDCGKTYVTVQLLKQAVAQGKTSLGLKPIAAGGKEDVLALQQASTVKLSYEQVNPFYLTKPLSPHLAAKIDNKTLTVQETALAVQPYLNQAQLCLVEGAGGIMVPINAQETMLDLMLALDIPVILVVGLRLGCLNHALLSYQVLKSASVKVAGWVATQVDPEMLCYEENIKTLQEKLEVPMLAQFNHSSKVCQNISVQPCVEASF